MPLTQSVTDMDDLELRAMRAIQDLRADQLETADVLAFIRPSGNRRHDVQRVLDAYERLQA